MALSDFLKRSKSSDAAHLQRTVAQLTNDRDRARADRDAAQAAWDEALTAEAVGEGEPGIVAAAERTLDAAQKVLLNKDAALAAARSKLDSVLAADRRSEQAKKWDKSISLAEARSKAAAQFVKDAEAMARSYHALLEVTATLAGSLPATPDADAASLNDVQLETAARLELNRLGLTWAITWPWGTSSLPAFLAPFEGTPQLVRRWRDEALAGR